MMVVTGRLSLIRVFSMVSLLSSTFGTIVGYDENVVPEVERQAEAVSCIGPSCRAEKRYGMNMGWVDKETSHSSPSEAHDGEKEAESTASQPSSSPTSSSSSSSSHYPKGLSPECDRTITGDRGRFTSPDYPARSTSFFRCRVTIVSGEGFVPVIVFSEFELMATTGDCTSAGAYVQVNAIEEHPDQLCGSLKPFSITADSNVVVVDMYGTPDAFHLFSATFNSINMVNTHFIIYDAVIGRFHSDALEFANPRDVFLLHAEPGSRIYVSFEEVTASPEIPVIVTDVVSDSVITVLNDRYGEFSVSSEGNEILIEFNRGPTSVLVFEFEVLRVEAQPYPECDIVLTNDVGNIQSPGYPTAYPANLDCVMTIRVDVGYSIRIIFSNFSVEPQTSEADTSGRVEESCGDYLQITDVTTDRTDRLCGMLYPFSWTSDSNEVMLIFHTDQELTSNGFYGQYIALENVFSDCITDSGSNLSLRSPDPRREQTTACTRLVSSDPTTIIVIEVYRFRTPLYEDYFRQGIQIRDVVTGRSDPYCGSLPMFTWTSDSNEVEIVIPSSPISEAVDFRATYRALPMPIRVQNYRDCRLTITNDRGDLNIPEVPMWPPVWNQNCVILFHAAPGRRFQLTIRDLVIESNDRAVEVDVAVESLSLEYSGTTISWRIQDISIQRENTSKAEVFTTSQPDFSWTSETNDVLMTVEQRSLDVATIHFRVEYYVENQITRENLEQVRCGHVIDSFPGFFSWTTPPHLCKIVFRARTFERVLLNVHSRNMREERRTSDNDCGGSHLEFRDVLTGRTERACFFQKDLTFSWLSESNELAVTARGPGLRVPMEISYRSVPRPRRDTSCYMFMVRPSGEFSATARDTGSAAAEECEIVIHVGSSERLNLQFRQFEIGNSFGTRNHVGTGEDCGETFVQIVDMTTNRTDRYCGQLELFSWTSDTNVVRVSFRALSDETYRGFRAIYSTLNRYKANLVRRVDAPMWNWLLRQPFNGTGHVASPNYPEPYPNNSRSEHILHTMPGKTIVLVSEGFDLDEQEDCTGDSVKIVDLGSTRGIVICGYHGPFTWTSDTNEVKVAFSSDVDVEGRGFYFRYQAVEATDACVKTVELNASARVMEARTDDITATMIREGALWSLGSCLLVVQATPEFLVRATFADLEPAGFNTGTVEILEVLNARLFNFELTDFRPWSFTSDGNALYVRIRAKQAVLPSLTISAHALSRPRPSGCSKLIINPAENESLHYFGDGEIDRFAVASSTNARDSVEYPHNATRHLQSLFVPAMGERMSRDCHVIIRNRPSLRLTIIFSVLESAGPVCRANAERPVIEIEDSTSLRLDSYEMCGAQEPFSWTSDTNDAFIRYHRYTVTQTLEIAANFISFQRPNESDVGCSKVLSGGTLTISSPNFPEIYPKNMHCQTVIHAPRKKRIQIVFTTFRLEGTAGSDCVLDYLELSDLTTGRVERACGSLLHYAFTSDANEVLIRFVSDAYIEEHGYRATYLFRDRIDQGGRVSNCNRTYTEEEGQLSVPDTAGAFCSFLIHAPPPLITILEIESLQLAGDHDCETDFVELFDTAVGISRRYCDFQESITYSSLGNELDIVYQTSGGNRGFTASYKQADPSSLSDCDDEFSTPQIITSPLFSAEPASNVQYANNLDCKYTFVADSREFIELVFLIFDLEDSDDCQYDYVEVQTTGIGTPQKYCGAHSEFLWSSTGSAAILRFHSDHIVAGRGFQVQFNTVPLEPPEECDLSFSSASGTFTSPGYPDVYPNNKDCKYRITVPPGYIVNITISQFQLEFHPTCSYDYIQLYNKPSGPVSPRICGPQLPFSFVSVTNEVLVEFRSDSSMAFHGFVANFTALPAVVVEEPKPVLAPLCPDQKFEGRGGVVTSPGFPFDYGNDEHCRIDIDVPETSSRIEITFHFLDIEEHPDCNWDFLLITDRESLRQSDRLCGLVTKPFVWQSDSSRVTITFHSDSMVTRKGFFATYEALPVYEENQSRRVL